MKRTTRTGITRYKICGGRRDGSNDSGTHDKAEGGKKLVRLEHVVKRSKECYGKNVWWTSLSLVGCGVVDVKERGESVGDEGGLSVKQFATSSF